MNILKCLRLLGLLALVVCAPLAHGAIAISYSINGSAPLVCGANPVSAGPVVCPVISVAPVTLSIVGAESNSPGTPAVSQVLESTLVLSSSAAATLDLWLAAQDFTTPTAPPDLEFLSSIAMTVTTGSGTANLTSCVNTDNTPIGIPPLDTFCSPGISLSNPALAYAPGANSNAVTSVITSLAAPYQLSQHIRIALGANTTSNLITSAVLRPVVPIPEPASVLFFGTVLLSVGGLLRNKFRKT